MWLDGSTIMADANREKLKGTDAANELSARDIVSRPVAEYLAALDAALPPSPDELAPADPTSISPIEACLAAYSTSCIESHALIERRASDPPANGRRKDTRGPPSQRQGNRPGRQG